MTSDIFKLIFATCLMGLALGLLFPVTPFFAQDLGASIDTVAMIFSVYSLCAMISAPVWGRVADTFGNKTVLLIGALGGVISYFWMANATALWEIFASRALAGSLSGWMAASQAMISQLVAQDKRTTYLGILGAAFGLGITLGPGSSSVLMHLLDLSFSSIYFVSSFIVAIGLFIATLIKEAYRRPNSSPEEKPKISLIPKISHNLPTVLFLLLISLTISLSFTVIEGVFALWSKQNFALTPIDVGYVLTASGVCAIIIQGGLIHKIIKMFGNINTIAIAIGLLLCGSAFLALSLSLTYAVIGIFFVTAGISLAGPPLQSSLMIGEKGKENRATVLGYNHSVTSLARVIGPTLGGVLLVHVDSQAPFVLSVILSLLALTLWFVKIRPISH